MSLHNPESQDMFELNNLKQSIIMKEPHDSHFFSSKVMRAIQSSQREAQLGKLKVRLIKIVLFVVFLLFPILTEAL